MAGCSVDFKVLLLSLDVGDSFGTRRLDTSSSGRRTVHHQLLLLAENEKMRNLPAKSGRRIIPCRLDVVNVQRG